MSASNQVLRAQLICLSVVSIPMRLTSMATPSTPCCATNSLRAVGCSCRDNLYAPWSVRALTCARLHRRRSSRLRWACSASLTHRKKTGGSLALICLICRGLRSCRNTSRCDRDRVARALHDRTPARACPAPLYPCLALRYHLDLPPEETQHSCIGNAARNNAIHLATIDL